MSKKCQIFHKVVWKYVYILTVESSAEIGQDLMRLWAGV